MLPLEGITKYEDKPLSPIEKAADLVEKFMFPYIMEGHKVHAVEKAFAKMSANIAVEEILSDKHICGCEQSVVMDGHNQTYHTYWSEVKRHIELL